MIDYPGNFILLIIAAIIAFIDKLFFMENGFILRKEGGKLILKKRKKDSAWANYIAYIASIICVVFVIDLFVQFLQQEADRLQQRVGGAQ